jgi:sulfite reductase alpha subunit-like flavoprotein
MVVVRYKSPIHRLKKGICSTWLANMQPNTRTLNQTHSIDRNVT